MTAADASSQRERRIVDVLMALHEGEVTTYGDVAEVAGHPRQARLVGRILATTDADVPWWRVVAASGRLVTAKSGLQARLLIDEGVVVTDGRVVDAPTGRFSRSGRSPRRRVAIRRPPQSQEPSAPSSAP